MQERLRGVRPETFFKRVEDVALRLQVFIDGKRIDWQKDREAGYSARPFWKGQPQISTHPEPPTPKSSVNVH